MSVVENSYYDHEQYGTVKVVSVEGGTVSMMQLEETIIVNSKKINKGVKQPVTVFETVTSPANVTVDAEAAVFGIVSKEA